MANGEALERALRAISDGLEAIEKRLENIDASVKILASETSELHQARIRLAEAGEAFAARLTLETSARKGADDVIDHTVDVLETRVSRLRDSVIEIERERRSVPPEEEKG